MPKISVVLNNYNYDAYISDALRSIVNQSAQPYEIIVIDDGSTDKSDSIIKSFLDKYPHIKFIKNDKNLGIAQTTNKAVKAATGEYIALLASDDIYLPQFIEKHLEAIEKFPQAGIVCSKFSYFLGHDIDNIFLHPEGFKPSSLTFLKNFSLIKTMRTYRFWIPSPVVMKKELFVKLGGYNHQFGRYTDFILYALISFLSGACYIPQTTCAVRKHADQLSENISSAKLEESWQAILNSFSYGDFQKFKTLLVKSHLLFLFGPAFLRFLVKNPKYWTFADYSLWKKLAIAWRRQKVDPKIKMILKNKTFRYEQN